MYRFVALRSTTGRSAVTMMATAELKPDRKEMTWMSNPANRLPPEYDEMQPQDYDPEFTADISTKMRVPDKIAAFNGSSLNGPHFDDIYGSDRERSARMNVPDKIVVVGQEQSVGMRAAPELHLDMAAFPDARDVPLSLSTPPRVLKVNEIQFPEDHLRPEPEATSTTSDEPPNGYVYRTPHKDNSDSLHHQALLATPGDHLLINDEADEITLLRKQIAKLSYHVVKLEEDNARRWQRELVLYPVVLGYLLLQAAKWFFSGR